MDLITKKDFDKVAEENIYYSTEDQARWGYFEVAIKWLKELDPKETLEVGPYSLPLDKEGHYVDRIDYGCKFGPRFVLHDVRKVPWPFEDKKFDVVIALQVWEHLTECQQKAFYELIRVSRHAIMSFPYRWPQGHEKDHVGIDKARISGWCLGQNPVKEFVVPSISERIIQLYRFE